MNWDAVIAADFETSGTLPEYALQPWRVAQGKSWATSLAGVMHKDGRFAASGGVEPTKSDIKAFLQYAVDNDITVLCWNAVFDIAWFLAYDCRDLVFKAKWMDGLLLWRHFFIEPEYDMNRSQKKSYSLKEFVREHLPKYAGYEKDIDFHDPSPEARAELHKYNVEDCTFTLIAAKRLWEALEPEQQRAAMIETACLPFVAEANLRGMKVDQLYASELRQHMTDVADAQLAALEEFGVTEKVVRSPKQLSALMYDEWKLPVYKVNTSKKTGNETRSTDKEALHELSFIDPRAKQLRAYREALGNRQKFAEVPLRSVEYNEDGKTHPSGIVFGTYSGRMTYASKQGKNKDERQTGFALHQMKRGPLFRGTILAPDDHVIIEFDASGQEFRWMAIASGDETMQKLCLPGEDAHSFMAARVTYGDYRKLMELVAIEDKEAKGTRQLGKVANLSLQYRTSARKLRSVARVDYNIPMEMPQAQQIRTTYLRAYPQIEKYWNRQIALTKQLGYVETFAGRRVRVVGDWEGKSGWSMGSTAINYKIQGTGADQKYLAMAVLKSYLVEHDIKFAWDLHDGIYLYVPKRYAEKVAVEGKYLLDRLPYKKAWGIVPPIPLPWDAKLGPSWGQLHEVKH